MTAEEWNEKYGDPEDGDQGVEQTEADAIVAAWEAVDVELPGGEA